jgi:DNA-binding NarL/FixJ family response regulator
VAEQQRRLGRAEDQQRVVSDAPAVVDVVLLTSDDKLLATLREAASTQHALWHANSANAAIELLVGGRCGILIADLALMQNDTLELLERLQVQFPELIILATGRPDQEAAVSAAISSGRIYRYLHKPVSPARASLFLGTATRRYGELRQISELALATLRQKARRPSANKLGWSMAAVAVAGALCLWYAVGRHSEPVANSGFQSPATDFLARAQAAFRSGRLSGNSGDDALSLYRSALDATPDSSEARSGIERVINALHKRVITALRRGDQGAASRAFEELRRAHPAHPHLATLNRQLQVLAIQLTPRDAGTTRPSTGVPSAARPGASLPLSAPSPLVTVPANAALPTDQAPQVAEPAAPVSSVSLPSTPRVSSAPTPQIDRARARLAASQLLAPVDDSAANYLRRAREAGEDETRLKITATDLGARLLDQSYQALLARNLETAQQDYNDAAALDREFELGLPDLEMIGRLLNEAHQAASPEPRRSTPIAPASESADDRVSSDDTAPP